MTGREVHFDSGGVRCAGWHFAGSGSAPRPAVVMAHGFAGTADSGLEPFAERLREAGLDVLAFDYRGFGRSEGSPRQRIGIDDQLADYRAALATAAALPGADASRLVLWGASLSGGHVIRLAAGRTDIAAVIAMTPMTNPLATGAKVIRQSGLAGALRATGLGVGSRIAAAAGRPGLLMPVVSEPGGGGALALDGCLTSYLAIAGPSWRNEIDASIGIELSRISTARYARALRTPLLVQIADFDRLVPAHAAARTAELGRAIVHRYPCDHFEVWPGNDWFEHAVADQLRFLRRVLG